MLKVCKVSEYVLYPSFPHKMPFMSCDTHFFTSKEVEYLQTNLLNWYKKNRRCLPWRVVEENVDPNQHAYAVLVSEVMLQQTQIVTVERYYKKWMTRWPVLQDLAKATLEEVNEMWAGLGYYARGRRLHDAVKKIATDLNGEVPRTSSQLQKLLPGVGRYTAGAVASIAFGEKVAAVDGNVIRVLTRLRQIGGDTANQAVMKDIWDIAETVVHSSESGDFNQAMMELGAMICTPKNPQCCSCPVKGVCKAYSLRDQPDIETVPKCHLCLPSNEKWDQELGVKNFPRKRRKTEARRQRTVVCVIYRSKKIGTKEYFILKRPATGLLANLWEFPSLLLKSTSQDEWAVMQEELKSVYGINMKSIMNTHYLKDIVHLFSHIRQEYVVYIVQMKPSAKIVTPKHLQAQRWATAEEIRNTAISTAMIKVLKAAEDTKNMKAAPKK